MTKIESIRDLFTYKPPRDEDKAKFEKVNQLSAEFAIGLSSLITNPDELTVLLRKIQEIRMLSNQAICYQSYGVSYIDILSAVLRRRFLRLIRVSVG